MSDLVADVPDTSLDISRKMLSSFFTSLPLLPRISRHQLCANVGADDVLVAEKFGRHFLFSNNL